jgi:hypothetical protein
LRRRDAGDSNVGPNLDSPGFDTVLIS